MGLSRGRATGRDGGDHRGANAPGGGKPGSEIMDTSQIFEHGIDAYGADTPRDDCPYPAGSDEREVWLGGWDEAKSIFDDEETSDNI
jgi:ribosome modulation factor